VAAYLSAPAIEDTLRAVAGCARGSRICFDYIEAEELWDADGREIMTVLGSMAGEGDEHLHTRFRPDDLDELVHRCGLWVTDHLSPADVHRRYFRRRRDGLRGFSMHALVTAVSPR
jgi:O-methyltransferase involved in polyketide biosynthesis